MDEQDRKRSVVKKTVWKGVSFGSVLAMVISYCNWHSVGWAIVHGLLRWVYVIYYVIRFFLKSRLTGKDGLRWWLCFWRKALKRWKPWPLWT